VYRRQRMDIIFIAIMIGLAAVSFGFIALCEKVK
jgi:hypothetical protein